MVPAYDFHKMETQHVRHSVTVLLIQMAVWVNGILSLGFGSHSSSIVLSPDESKVAAVNQDSGTISIWSWLGCGRADDYGSSVSFPSYCQ